VLYQDDQPELGLAATLYEASVAGFAALLRILLEDSAGLDQNSSSYEVLRNEFQKFYLWNHGFSTTSGELDRILSCSKNLRAAVLALMVRWAKTVCRSNNLPSLIPQLLSTRESLYSILNSESANLNTTLSSSSIIKL
jgi:hypothetical protein